MKKLFFTFLALVTMSVLSVSLSSCSKDNDSTKPTDDPEKKTTYVFDYVVAEDVYNLFDIKTTLTIGSTTSDLPYSQATTIAIGKTTYNAMSVGPKEVEVKQNTKVATKTTCTLKSNWKEVIASKKIHNLFVKAMVKSNGITFGTGMSSLATLDTDDFEGDEQLLHDALNALAEVYEIALEYNSDSK